ncbi:MAG: hypothetical protein GY757_08565, partial [bacterium]|nr:hypothetical protein [bacterium]
MRRTILFVLTLMCILTVTLADSIEDNSGKDAFFRHLSVEHGLSGNMIFFMFQDSKGFMWIGTDNGLNKYDGISSTIYPRVSGAPGALSSKYISCMVEDRNGVLWFGTKTNGLNRYNAQHDNFTVFNHVPGKPGGLSDDKVLSLHEDS